MFEKQYCMQGQHFVSTEKMSSLNTGKVTRRLCEDCKDRALQRLRKERAKNKKACVKDSVRV
jgi:hypothetical protein